MATAALLRAVSRTMVALGVLTAVFLVTPGPATAAGPWQAQIVDAETGHPLEGVVVLFHWMKMTRTPGGPSPSFHDAEEVVTGPDGRFTIPSKFHFTLNPFRYIDGPRVVIFKPGYGAWRVRSGLPEEWATDEEKKYATAGEVLALPGLVLEMPQLKTRDERLGFYRSPRFTGFTPPERMKKLTEAVMNERRYLGFEDERGRR